jgi:hypothetical protein
MYEEIREQYVDPKCQKADLDPELQIIEQQVYYYHRA